MLPGSGTTAYMQQAESILCRVVGAAAAWRKCGLVAVAGRLSVDTDNDKSKQRIVAGRQV